MSCDKVQQLIPQLFGRKLAGEARENVLQHLADCRRCSARAESLDGVRAMLREMRAIPVPARLTAQLRIAASKERVRQLSRRSLGEWLRCWADSGRLTVDNLMRPLALPFAGGVFSAFLLFSALVPTLVVQRSIGADVPISLFTDPTLEDIGHGHNSDVETIMELTVDERGRVTDYSIPQGKLSPEMENDLLFFRFAPATAFGQPTWGRVTITFRRTNGGSFIVVRG
jgi:putative zinc finger protein